MACLDTIGTIVAIETQKKWEVYQIDVKSAFINGFSEEEVYVEQSSRYEIMGHKNKVYKLKKALYGLKQAPRVWYGRIGSIFYKMDSIGATVSLPNILS